MIRHPLDRPAWNALGSHHAKFAVSSKLARRYINEFGLFAAARDDSPESLQALSDIMPKGSALLLLQAGQYPLPPDTRLQDRMDAVQMVARNIEPAEPGPKVTPLTNTDAPAMIELATLTQPGPFFARTNELGQFWGVKEGGRLVAMAGERMRLEGFTEVSGVCTHPECRGRGYAGLLSRVVATQILKRGDVPFLHAVATNTSAIRLYQTLGFEQRSPMTASVLIRA
ncbi:MAG: GNAT family N-acetyltransferase [Micropepsaceae bacterium]